MKNEMIKFVSENFEMIKLNYFNIEKDIIEDLDEDDDEINEMIDELNNQMSEVNNALDLIELINERGLGIDFSDKDDCEELFDMIKNIID
jgi:hypothetical protein